MTPEDRKQFEEMKQKLQSIVDVQNLDFIEKLVDNQIKRFTNVIDADVTLAAVDDNGDTVNVLDFPDEWKIIEYKGSLYRVPIYLESRF